jgi:3'-phosphoadenosine 5'-phosphosulfate sulfotransferase (PAPS reductase)/FAD synthetase
MDFVEYDLFNFQNSKSLRRKLQSSLILIEESCEGKDKICLSFSGGKDSLVCFLLLVKCQIKFGAVWFNSGYEYPETESFIREICEKYSVPLRVIEPHLDPLQAKIQAGFFDLDKINKANKEILSNWHNSNKEYDLVVTGLRIQESKARRMTILKNGQFFYNKSFGSWALYPVARFEAKEVFALIAGLGEKYHPLYDKAKSLDERDWLRVNWYILTSAQNGYYTFLKREYPEQYYNLSLYLPEVRAYV